MTVPLLEIRGLRVHYAGEPEVEALRGIDLTVEAGQSIGILGESGCGKTTLVSAIPGLLPANGGVVDGDILWRGRSLLGRREPELRALRGADIATIFQEPGLALHPTRRVCDQVVEVLRAHGLPKRGSHTARRQRALGLLAEVGLEGDPATAFPHQLSGGQRQRVLIAQALACDPALVLADEPTASLDAVTAAEILDLSKRLERTRGTAFLHISHDVDALRRVAEFVVVLHDGRVVESGPMAEVLGNPLADAGPRHPHTRALLASLPPPGGRPEGAPRELPVPDPGDGDAGLDGASRGR